MFTLVKIINMFQAVQKTNKNNIKDFIESFFINFEKSVENAYTFTKFKMLEKCFSSPC